MSEVENVEKDVSRETRFTTALVQAAGRRPYRRHARGFCKCGNAGRPGNPYECSGCHAADMKHRRTAARLEEKTDG